MVETRLDPDERAARALAFVEAFPVLKNFAGQIPEIVLQDLQTRFGSRLATAGSPGAEIHLSGILKGQLTTPMMKQFATAREKYPDALLFFRMGDFFELFGLDAVIASHICRLTLTSRDKGAEDPVPMAGVPVVNVKSSLKRCVEAGFKVALCDQIEDPKDAKALVRRDIVRVLTPAVSGDLFEEEEGSPAGDFLASLWLDDESFQGRWCLAAVDSATGDVRLAEGVSQHVFEEEILSLEPREVLASASMASRLRKRVQQIFGPRGRVVPVVRVAPTPAPKNERERDAKLNEIFGDDRPSLEAAQSVAGGREALLALASYVTEMQRQGELHWKSLRLIRRDETLLMDAATRDHLQLFGSRSRGGATEAPSLFQFLGGCVTTAGQRLLYSRMQAPAAKREAVDELLSRTELFFASGQAFRDELRASLSLCSDVDRLISRLLMGSASPREILALRRTLRAAVGIGEAFRRALESKAIPDSFGRQASAWVEGPFFQGGLEQGPLHPILERLEIAVVESPDLHLGKGVFFKEGFDETLERLTRLASGIDTEMKKLLEKEKEVTGLSSLKLGYNRVFGSYFEVSRNKVAQLPDHFIRKQTLANAERYITEELKNLESAVATAQDDKARVERELFSRLVEDILGHQRELSALNDTLAAIDLHANLARLAFSHAWTKPEISDAPRSRLGGVVHPVLDAQMKAVGQAFVPNDAHLAAAPEVTGDEAAILLITGPNMAGKSTIMRQVALVHLMAQMGSFVPCAQATVGLCDRIFTRIGAGDDLFGARSTFMVEMSETAQILKQATSRSLILMDEIGRGTSTWDGMALAWSILEELDATGARTLFSTHYHELCAACENLKVTKPMQVEVLENPGAEEASDKIIFTHRFVTGAAAESYGIHVARLAGLPEGVLHRARARLEGLVRFSGQKGAQTSKPISNGESSSTTKSENSDLALVSSSGLVNTVPSTTQESSPGKGDLEAESRRTGEGFQESRKGVIEALLSLPLEETSPLELMIQVARWQADLRGGRSVERKDLGRGLSSVSHTPAKKSRQRRSDSTMEPLF